jgi:hypothetical protein
MHISKIFTFRLLLRATLILFSLSSLVILNHSFPPPLRASNNESLRIATYSLNEGGSNLVEDTTSVITQSGADVLLLQHLDANTAFLLARHTQMDVTFFLVTEEAQGLAVLSKTRIAFDDGQLLGGSENLGSVQRVQIFVGTETLLTLYNIGLGFNQHGTEGITEQSLNETLAIIANDYPNGITGEKIIIGGSFNPISDLSVVQQIETLGFLDPFSGFSLENSATVLNPAMQNHVPYLWTRNLQVVAANLTEDSASDRRVAIIEIQIAAS